MLGISQNNAPLTKWEPYPLEGQDCCCCPCLLLGDDPVDHLPVHVRQAEVTPGVTVSELFMVDAQQVQNGGMQVVKMHRIVPGVVAVVIAPPPSPAREAPGNQSWKSNFLAISQTLQVSFALAGFDMGATVTPSITWGGEAVGGADDLSFTWDSDDSNYIGITARQGQQGFSFDNLSIETIPEPSIALLGSFGLLGLLRRRRA